MLELIFHLIFYDHVFEAKIQKTLSVSFFRSVFFPFVCLVDVVYVVRQLLEKQPRDLQGRIDRRRRRMGANHDCKDNLLDLMKQVANLFLPWCEECPHSIF